MPIGWRVSKMKVIGRLGMIAVLLIVAPILGLPVLGQSDAPEKPLQLEAKIEYQGANGLVQLQWRDMSDNELGFEILRSDNNGEFRVISMAAANATRHRDQVGKYVTGVFAYKVRAFNENGKSEESNVASVWF